MSESSKTDPIKLFKWSALVVSLLWIAGLGWLEVGQRYLDTGLFGLGPLFDQRYDQRVKDCRGSFVKRYECKSGHMREKRVKVFYFWSETLGIIFGPPAALGLVWMWLYFTVERKREFERRRVRLLGLQEKAAAVRQRAIEAGRLEIEEVKQRKETEARTTHTATLNRRWITTWPCRTHRRASEPARTEPTWGLPEEHVRRTENLTDSCTCQRVGIASAI